MPASYTEQVQGTLHCLPSPTPNQREVPISTQLNPSTMLTVHSPVSSAKKKATCVQPSRHWMWRVEDNGQTACRCYNCLFTRHQSRDCTNHGRCRECNGQHHTLLHIITQSQASTPTMNAPDAAGILLLPASYVDLQSQFYVQQWFKWTLVFGSRTATLMLDEGAKVSLIIFSLARTINDNFKPCSLRIDGVGPSTISCRHTVDIAVHLIFLKQSSLSYPSPVSMHCYVIDKPFHVNTSLDSTDICQLMADRALEPLADPALSRPPKVELLLCGGDSHQCYIGPDFYCGDRSLKFVRTLF